MSEMMAAIDNLQECIFDYDVTSINKVFIQLVNQLEAFTPMVSENSKMLYNNILLCMLQALERKDYLWLADLAEYELKPFVRNVLGGA